MTAVEGHRMRTDTGNQFRMIDEDPAADDDAGADSRERIGGLLHIFNTCRRLLIVFVHQAQSLD